MQKFNDCIKIRPAMIVLFVVAIYTIPLKWLMGWLAAVAVHELSHILTLKIMGIKSKFVSLGITGALIETEPMEPLQELIAALSGPFGGLFLLFLGRMFPYCAVCALVQSVFNLLPIYPLDGGRALQCVLGGVIGIKRADLICLWIGRVTILLLALLLLYGSYIFKLGLLPIALILLVTVRMFPAKYPCKRNRKIVQ